MAAHIRGHLPGRIGEWRGRPARPVPAGGQPAAGRPGTAGRPAPVHPDVRWGASPPGGAASYTPRWPTRSTGSSRCWWASSGGSVGLHPAPLRSRVLGRVLLVGRGAPAAARTTRRSWPGSDPTPRSSTCSSRGELDVAVTSLSPGRRSLASTADRHQAVRPGRHARRGRRTAPVTSLPELGPWLAGRAWVAYSAELPMTRGSGVRRWGARSAATCAWSPPTSGRWWPPSSTGSGSACSPSSPAPRPWPGAPSSSSARWRTSCRPSRGSPAPGSPISTAARVHRLRRTTWPDRPSNP